jgi:Methyltransferase domain
MNLPFTDKAFDLVISQFGVMFFPDRVRGHRETPRVLVEDGSAMHVVWDGLDGNDFARVMHSVIVEQVPDGADFLARVPHGYHVPAQIRSDLAAGGFESVAIEAIQIEVTADAAAVASGFVYGTPLRTATSTAGVDHASIAERATATLLKRLGGKGGSNGAVTGQLRALLSTARR